MPLLSSIAAGSCLSLESEHKELDSSSIWRWVSAFTSIFVSRILYSLFKIIIMSSHQRIKMVRWISGFLFPLLLISGILLFQGPGWLLASTFEPLPMYRASISGKVCWSRLGKANFQSSSMHSSGISRRYNDQNLRCARFHAGRFEAILRIQHQKLLLRLHPHKPYPPKNLPLLEAMIQWFRRRSYCLFYNP